MARIARVGGKEGFGCETSGLFYFLVFELSHGFWIFMCLFYSFLRESAVGCYTAAGVYVCVCIVTL